MKKLNMGCGRDIKKGYINLDSIKLPGVDIVHNLEKFPWPFKDNEFDMIISSHVLEHLGDTLNNMEEIWRILKPGGTIIIKVPNASHRVAFVDPTHKRYFTLNTFDYFQENHGYNYYSSARFKIIEKKFADRHLPQIVLKIINSSLMQKLYDRFIIHLFPLEELHYKMECIK